MIINVTQYNNFLKALIENEPMLSNVSVCGEVSNLRYTSESIFLSLKDAFCQMDCFMYVDKLTTQIKNGQEVIIDGRVNYIKSGRVSFFVDKITITDKDGDQYKKLLELKDRLNKLGFFNQERKKILPKYIFNIGVVTSQNGAVIHDIINVISRRNKYAKIFLYDAKVQGEDASTQIAQGIDYFNSQPVDCLIIARGGGSKEDLSAFDTEIVALALSKSTKPTISAVGHETDLSICDFCADVRAGTPSIAAELVTNFSIDKDLSDMNTRIYNAFIQNYTEYKNSIKKIFSYFNNLLDLKTANSYTYDLILLQIRRFFSCLSNLLSTKKTEYLHLKDKIQFSSLQNSLKRGNAIITKDNKRISTIKDLTQKDKITIYLNDGKITTTIDEVTTYDF